MVAGLVVAALPPGPAPALATAEVDPAAPTPAPIVAEVGTVSTLAGPELCAGRAVVDREASTVRALAVDESGRIYVDTGPTSEGVVGTVDPEGNAALVPTGLAGPPADPEARVDVSPPARLAPDGAGGVLMAVGHRIVQLHQRGGATVVAGDEPASSPDGGEGDGGPLVAARFADVASLASDGTGNLFVAERVSGPRPGVRVRLANRGSEPVTVYPGTSHERTIAPGAIDTVAGLATAKSTANAPALTAHLDGAPPAMAVAGTMLYLAASVEAPEPRSGVQLVNLGGEPVVAHGVTVAPGAVETVAGGGPSGFAGDEGEAREAAFSDVTGITVDPAGDLYLADAGNHRVRKVDAAGVVTTFAGTGGTGANAGGFDGNDRPAVEARLNRPYDVKADPEGRIYISDQLNHQLRFVDQAGVIHAARGNGVGLSWVCPERPAPPIRGLTPPPAGTDPSGLAVAGGEVYFGAPSAGMVMKIDEAGAVSPVEAAGPGFRQPRAVAVADDGARLYVLDGHVLAVNRGAGVVDLHGVTIEPGSAAVVVEPGPGAGTGLLPQLPPGALAAGAGGDVFLTDINDFFVGRIRHLDATGELRAITGPDDQLGDSRCCGRPAGFAVDAGGNLYVASAQPPQVWFVNRGTTPVGAQGQTVPPGQARVVAGTTEPGFGGDGGSAVEAQLMEPRGVAVDGQGTVYVSDAGEHTVRRIGASGLISTVAGTGSAAFNGDGLNAAITALARPGALAVDGCGNLLVADAGNQRVRRVNLVGPCPVEPDADEGGTSALPVLAGVVVVGMLAGTVGGVLVGRRRGRGTAR